MLDLESYRCPICHKLLFKAGIEFEGRIFIICPRCDKQVIFVRKDGQIYSDYL